MVLCSFNYKPIYVPLIIITAFHSITHSCVGEDNSYIKNWSLEEEKENGEFTTIHQHIQSYLIQSS